MIIKAPLVNIKAGGDDLWFVRDNDNVLHQVRDIAHLGAGHVTVVEATVVSYQDGAINVPDSQVRVKGGDA